MKPASRAGTILGVRSISEDDEVVDEAPWLRSPSGELPTPAVRGPLPEILHATLAPDAVDALQVYEWPGNVRELENVLSRAVIQAAFGTPRGSPVLLTNSALRLEPMASGGEPQLTKVEASAGKPLRELVDEFRRATILRAVRSHGGNWAAAAHDLGMHRSNLHNFARRLGISPSR